MKPGELIILRQTVAVLEKQVKDLRAIGSTYMIQANDLKAWIICILKKTGPIEVTQQELEALGVDEEGRPCPKGIVFTVMPNEDRPGVYTLTVGDLEREPTPSEGGEAPPSGASA